MRTLVYLILAGASLQLMCSSNTSEQTTDDMDVSKILKAIGKGENLHIKGQKISSTIDLTELDAILSNTAYYVVPVQSQLTFEDCTFEGKFLAYSNADGTQKVCRFLNGLSFMNCIFKEEVSFKGATVEGFTNFGKSFFHEEAHFEGCTFQSEVNFSNTNFLKDIFFQQSRFTKATNFMQSNLGGISSFQGAQFDGNTQFGVCEFHEYADFSKVVFNEDCFFDYAKFHGQAVFSNGRYRGRAEFKSCEYDKKMTIKGAAFYGNVRFNESIFKDAFDLTGARFMYGAPETRAIKLDNQELITLQDAKYNSFSVLELEGL
jgi:uncharacterized protein YjbI with pentapeptide repeats